MEKQNDTTKTAISSNGVLPAVFIFKCRECGWEGQEKEMKYADNGWDYSEYCPKCGDCMISNANYYCDEVKK